MSWDTHSKTGSCPWRLAGQDVFSNTRPRQHWTPHPGRCFMPSATAVLKYEKSERDFLGGWSARGSDVCTAERDLEHT